MNEESANVETALLELSQGRLVVLVGSGSGEDEGHLVLAAEMATRQTLAFMVEHSSGFVCAALTQNECDRMALPPMTTTYPGPTGRYHGVSVDAASGIGTGISAQDRANTLRLLANPTSNAAHFNRPGHVVPVRVASGGTLAVKGAAEAATDLLRAAGLRSVGAIAALVSPADGRRMADESECWEFARTHNIHAISIDDVAVRQAFGMARIS